MTARGTVLWLMLAALSAFALIPITYQVKSLEDELAEINAARIASEGAIHVLNAEWAFLTRPERLAADAARILGVVPLVAEQIVGVEMIPLRGAAPADAAPIDGVVAP